MAIIDKVKADEFEMEYCKFGVGETPFVIIPGISLKSVVASADAIENQFKAFCDDFTVYLFDRKLSIDDGYSVEDMAEDTAKAMQSLGIKNANMYGASQGGMIVQCITINHPELVSKIVLASTAPRANQIMNNTLNRWLSLASKESLNELIEGFVDDIYTKETLDVYRDFLISQNTNASASEVEKFLHLVKGTIGFDVYDKLESIKCPALAIGGRLDKVLGVEGTIEIANKLGCEHYIYENYGHAVYDEASDFIQRMIDFFRK